MMVDDCSQFLEARMRRIATALVRLRIAVMWTVVAVLCLARAAAADCTMDRGATASPQTFGPAGGEITALISFVNRAILTNNGTQLVAFPCKYLVVAEAGWLVSQYGNPSAPLGGTLPTPAYETPTGVSLFLDIRPDGPNPRCEARYADVSGLTRPSASGSGVSRWLIVSTVQVPRPKEFQPDGTLKCVPDTTGKKFIFKTKSVAMGDRG
jgi:hypothetical protein